MAASRCATAAPSPASPALRTRLPAPTPTLQSAQADFVPFQRRVSNPSVSNPSNVPPRYRIFSVANATSAHMIPMIQNRMITLLSCHPICSKWWWSGAMRKIRRPLP